MTLPQIMGIVNVTPDSFSDGGRLTTLDVAKNHGLKLWQDGADILDIGGESTRPGALEVPVDEEIARVVPVIEALKSSEPQVVISVDTRKSKVAEAAIKAGADIINDVSALTFDLKLGEVVAKYGKKLILGHTRGVPEVMRQAENCCYGDVVSAVCDFLSQSAELAISQGVLSSNIIYDPGLGFAKECDDDCKILQNIARLKELGQVMIGHSRKSFIGKIVEEKAPLMREAGTIAVSIWSANLGADYLRVHDVYATKQALTMWGRLSSKEAVC